MLKRSRTGCRGMGDIWCTKTAKIAGRDGGPSASTAFGTGSGNTAGDIACTIVVACSSV